MVLPLHQTTAFPICPHCTHLHGKVDLFQILTGYKHVAPGIESLWLVTQLQNQYHVPHVVENEVYPEVGSTRDPPRNSLYRTHHLSSCPGDGYPVGLGFFQEGCVTHTFLYNALLFLVKGHKLSRRKVHHALGTANLLVLSDLVCYDLPCHPTSVCLL